MRRFRWEKSYLYWGITAFLVIAASIVFYMLLRYLPMVGEALKKLGAILSPFILGFIIAYLMLPFKRYLYREVFKPFFVKLFSQKKYLTAKKTANGLAVFTALLTFIAGLSVLVYLIIPQLYSSIKTIVENSGNYVDATTKWLKQLLVNYPEIEQVVLPKLSDLTQNIIQWVQTTVLPGIGSLATSLTSGVISVFRAAYNLIVGVIVSAYVLSNYEDMSASIKRVLYSIFTAQFVKKILEDIHFINDTFMSFIGGKVLDSFIVAIICYICCAFLKIPYPLLVSVIVGVTNIIPFFGPFIGAVPCAFLILMVSPLKCLEFVIMIVILQQVDGNIIGPKILGSSVGINGFWIMFSIIFGAGVFGFWGMLLGVPVFVCIYTALSNSVEHKLKRSGLPMETANYMNLDYIDPDTLEPITKEEAKHKPYQRKPKDSDKKPEERKN